APKCYIDLMKKCWDPNPDNRPNTTEVLNLIRLFQYSYVSDFKYRKSIEKKQNYEIENQFKEAEEYRKANLSSIKNNKLTTHPQAIYTSRLLNPFTKDLPKEHDNINSVEIINLPKEHDNIDNNSVEIIDFTK